VATLYIDPTAGVNGDGSIGSPFNTWSGITWTAGNEYLQKRGTTYAATVATGASGGPTTRITIGAYGEGDRPKIRPASGEGINITFAHGDITVRDLDILTVTGNGITARGGSATTTHRVYIYNCKIKSGNAIGVDIRGRYDQVIGNYIYECGSDGVFAQSSDFLVSGNTIVDCDTLLTNGDGIQLSPLSSHDAFTVVIRGCYIRHPSSSPKQAIVCQGNASGGLIIEGNVLSGGNQVIYTDMPGTRIRRNRISGGGVRAIGWSATSGVIESNVIEDSLRGIVADAGAPSINVRGNVFRGQSVACMLTEGAASGITYTASNNVYKDAERVYDVLSGGTITEATCWHDGVASTAKIGVTTYATLAELQGAGIGASSSSGDAWIDDESRLRFGSPLIGAGTHGTYYRDINGRQRPNPPSIGAHDGAVFSAYEAP